MSANYGFTMKEEKEYRRVFDSFDTDGSGRIDERELGKALRSLGEYVDSNQIKSMIAEVDKDSDGQISWEEFLIVVGNLRGPGKGVAFAKVYEKQKQIIQVKGKSGVHSFSQEEMTAFTEHLNHVLQDDADLKHLVPIDSTGSQLCSAVRDGLLLSKFINKAVPDTIDERVLNKAKGGSKLSVFQIHENQQLMLQSAKSIGVNTTTVGAGELEQGEKHPHLVLGITWQLVKIHLLNQINLKNFPELVRLLEPGETLEDLLRLPPDQLLLRWFNYHLRAAGSNKRVTNFGKDVKDSEAYTILLHQIAPARCDTKALQTSNMSQRAGMVIQNAGNVGAHAMIKPRDIVSGNKRLNLAFTASIFNACPGLDPIEEPIDIVEETREEKAFRMWINSMGLDGVFLQELYHGVEDGLALLKVIDHIEPGIVSWRQVEKKPGNRFKKVANCNYAIVLCKQLKFSLVGIGGVDITDQKKKLVLAVLWQLMRHHTVKLLSELQFGGKPVSDKQIIDWCNDKVSSSGSSRQMSSFKDKSLSDSLFFLDLLAAVDDRVVNKDLINTNCANDDDKLSNASYAVSAARKMGCTIFCLPEDLFEVKPKMALTFCAAVWVVALQRES